MTALMSASHRGQTATAQCLILHGADVNATSEWGKTALMYAADLTEQYVDFNKGDVTDPSTLGG